MKKPHLRPTAEQLSALENYRAWAENHKPRSDWKAMLLFDWQRAGSRWPEANQRWHLLQQLRNQLGPNWLTEFKFCGGSEHCPHPATSPRSCPHAEHPCTCCPACEQHCRTPG